jgi:hypothetical protein
LNFVIYSPSTIADLIGYSIRIVRSNARTCVKLLLWPSVVELVGKIVMLIGVNMLHSVQAKGSSGLLLTVDAGLLTFVGVMIQFVAEFFLTMRQLALFRVLAGYSNSYNEAYAFVTKRKFFLLATIMATCVLTTVVLIFWLSIIGILVALVAKKVLIAVCVTAALIALVGLLVSTFLVSQPSVFLCPALAIEDRSFQQLVGWCFQICIKTFWRTPGFASLLTVVFLLLWSAISIPEEILRGLDWSRIHYLGGRTWDEQHLYVEVFASVWSSGASLLLSPFFYFSTGFYYLDVRMRTDGLDITKRIETLSNPL